MLLKYALEHLADGKHTISEIVRKLDQELNTKGFSFAEGAHIACGYAAPRIQEIYSCFNRYRR